MEHGCSEIGECRILTVEVKITGVNNLARLNIYREKAIEHRFTYVIFSVEVR